MVSKFPTKPATAAENIRLGTERMVKILDVLGGEFKIRKKRGDPYEVLVRTVLSQHTNDRNSGPASAALLKNIKGWKELARADVKDIQRLIRPAGLQRAKARHLKTIAQDVLDRYDGRLEKVLKKPVDAARSELLSLSGVGYKTADVVLAFAAGRDVIAVDTHVFRVSKRLGFALKEDDHEEVKTKLEKFVPAGRRVEAHLLLIQLGREYCRAIAPLHEKCPVNKFCPTWNPKVSPRAQARSTT
jgi:endonuclease-3